MAGTPGETVKKPKEQTEEPMMFQNEMKMQDKRKGIRTSDMVASETKRWQGNTMVREERRRPWLCQKKMELQKEKRRHIRSTWRQRRSTESRGLRIKLGEE